MALDNATPSYASLSMDQVSSDSTPTVAALLSNQALTAAPVIAGAPCHPHLFIRQREVVERINRHIYKALVHVDAVLANSPLTSTDSTKTWESVENGIDRKFIIMLVAPDVYTWELDIGPAGTTLQVAMVGEINRTGVTAPHQGKGTLHIDFAKLHAGFAAEKVTQGTLDAQFDVETGSRNITVTASDIDWDLDPTMFDSAALVSAARRRAVARMCTTASPERGAASRSRTRWSSPARRTPRSSQPTHSWSRAGTSLPTVRSTAGPTRFCRTGSCRRPASTTSWA